MEKEAIIEIINVFKGNKSIKNILMILLIVLSSIFYCVFAIHFREYSLVSVNLISSL